MAPTEDSAQRHPPAQPGGERHSGAGGAPSGSAARADFEELLARSIDARVLGDQRAVDELRRLHPEHAGRLAERLSELERMGLLEPEKESADPQSLPERIGGHEILRRLGSGGMGEVYLARESGGPLVALKWARFSSADSKARERLHERFEREARAIGAVAHPNLARLIASGTHEGSPWFTLDFVEGTTLAAILARLKKHASRTDQLRLSEVELAWSESARAPTDSGLDVAAPRFARARSHVEWAVRVAVDVAAALAEIHARGIVHRDVKPSNIMIRRDGSACLLDLGLAHFADLPALTRTGDFAGTPYYVAPEQVEGAGRAIDARTDVWAMGVTLFEALTLSRPFEGQGTPQILKRVLDADPPRPSSLRPGLPKDLEAILLKCLEKAPRRRYAKASDLGMDLERLLAFQPVVARPASLLERGMELARRRPALALAWGLSAFVVLGLPLGLWSHGRAISREARRTELAAVEARDQAQARARTLEHLVELFRPDAGGRALVPPAVLQALDGQIERLQAASGESTLTRATWLEAVGTIYRNLGLADRALPLLDRALAAHSSIASREAGAAELLEVLATVHLELGDGATARALCERALRETQASASGEPTSGARAHLTLARALLLQQEPAGAREHLDHAVQMLSAEPAALPQELARALKERGRLRAARGEESQARADFERALDIEQRAWLPDPLALARGWREMAALLKPSTLGESPRSALRAQALERAATQAAPAALLPSLALDAEWKASYADHFQRGITALQTRDLTTAQQQFELCLALKPREGVCAYNLACSHALAGTTDAAFAWLERAVSWGWGFAARQFELLERDSDLAGLRGEKRWKNFVDALASDGQRMAEFVDYPEVVVPTGAASAGAPAALVVLHDLGATKLDVASGPWRALAGELGCVLIAPSATVPQGATPELGLAWFSDLATFVEQPWTVERSILTQVQRAMHAHGVDPGRAILVGEGQGGLVAFDLALRAPGNFRAVFVQSCAFLCEPSARRAHVAAALVPHLGFAHGPSSSVYGLDAKLDPAQALTDMRQWAAAIWGAGFKEFLAPATCTENLRPWLAEVLEAR